MADAQLPLGWTVQRIHDISGDREAVALHPNRAVQWVAGAGAPGCGRGSNTTPPRVREATAPRNPSFPSWGAARWRRLILTQLRIRGLLTRLSLGVGPGTVRSTSPTGDGVSDRGDDVRECWSGGVGGSPGLGVGAGSGGRPDGGWAATGVGPSRPEHRWPGSELGRRSGWLRRPGHLGSQFARHGPREWGRSASASRAAWNRSRGRHHRISPGQLLEGHRAEDSTHPARGPAWDG